MTQILGTGTLNENLYFKESKSVSLFHVENCGGLFETAFAFYYRLNYFSKSRLEKLTN